MLPQEGRLSHQLLPLLSLAPCQPSGRSLDVFVHQQPCQMFPRKAVAEGSEKHKYFVTFLGFAEPGIPRGPAMA